MVYPLPSAKRVQFVVKVSKLCNLRCRYCYEFEDLADKRRIHPDSLEQMYWNIAGWYRTLDPATKLEFVWHGGEPMLVEPDYYWKTFERQRAIFGTDLPLRNIVQTNLTVLDEDRLDLLQNGFDGVGVSVDLFGELRVNAGGKDALPKTLRNMDLLLAKKINFGAITVVSKANVGNIRKIIQFFHRLKVPSLRLLPLFDGAYTDQHQGYEIQHEEVLEAFKTTFEELHTLDSPMRVEPIDRLINQVNHLHSKGSAPSIYDKRSWEPVLLVETDGSVYSYGDTSPDFCHGNLFDMPMEACIHSPGHLAACEVSEARMRATCHNCRFFHSCDGAAMADEAGRHRSTLGEVEQLECVVEKGMLEYLERRMAELGIIDPSASEPHIPAPTAASRWLEHVPLQPGVRVAFGPDCDPTGRIQLSAGTTHEVEAPSDGLSYLDVAVVPGRPFRNPLPAEEQLLVTSRTPKHWEIGSQIGVVRLPDDVMVPFEKIFEDYGTREVLDRSIYQDHTTHPGWQEAYRGLSAHLVQTYALRDHGPTVVRLASAIPGMRTVTKDEVKNQEEHVYVGLHLDTWEQVPMAERAEARNRICINMGREAREFLFINLTVGQMFETLRRGQKKISDYYGTDLGHEFMNAFPGYPVVKLKVQPREAYIAPTDNLVHDATSVGRRYPDIALHVLGYFGMVPGETRIAGELQVRERIQY